MSNSLTEYEESAVMDIAHWKAEKPSRVSRAFEFFRKPLNAVTGRVVSGSAMRSVCARVEAIIDQQKGRDEIVRTAGVGAVEELAHRTLEECDQLAEHVSVHAQRRALLESGAAGAAGIVGAAVYLPVLVRAAIRAIRRIGHCYGYSLATDRDRHYVMGVLELATAEEPELRQDIRARLYALMHDPKMVPLELHGVRRALAEDLVIESLPILGEVAAVVLDYAFMRRVDIAARRVFQERWLRRRGKVLVIPPVEAGLPSRSLSVAWEASREAIYLGSFGLGFVVTLPVAAAAMVLKRTLPEPAIRGATDGARDAVASADRLRERVGVESIAPLPAPRPAL
jgi:EcsC protein family